MPLCRPYLSRPGKIGRGVYIVYLCGTEKGKLMVVGENDSQLACQAGLPDPIFRCPVDDSPTAGLWLGNGWSYSMSPALRNISVLDGWSAGDAPLNIADWWTVRLDASAFSKVGNPNWAGVSAFRWAITGSDAMTIRPDNINQIVLDFVTLRQRHFTIPMQYPRKPFGISRCRCF